MEPLKSTDASDATAVRQALEAQGYAYLPAVLAMAELERLRQAAEDILVRTGWSDLGGTVTRSSAVWREAYTRIQECEVLHRVATSGPFSELMSEVLDGDALCQPCKTVRIVAPGAGAETTRPHQDFPYIQGSVDTITCWVPFHDVPLSNGPLRLVPGSHRGGVLPMKAVPGDGGLGVKEPPELGWHASRVGQGDVIVFASLLVHAALPNVTSRFRLSMDFRYQRRDDPICLPQTRPYPDSRGRRTWAEIGAAWSADTLARCLPEGLRTVPFIAPRDPASWHEELQLLVPAGGPA